MPKSANLRKSQIPSQVYVRNCHKCQKEFGTNFKRQKYCSFECSYDPPVLDPSRFHAVTVGAYNELRVSVNLIERGYQVFRALSPASDCDLIAMREGCVWRIEVRTGRRTSQSINYVKTKVRADIVAVALSNEIVYIPDLPVVPVL